METDKRGRGLIPHPHLVVKNQEGYLCCTGTSEYQCQEEEFPHLAVKISRILSS